MISLYIGRSGGRVMSQNVEVWDGIRFHIIDSKHFDEPHENDGPEIMSVSTSPGTKIRVGTEVTFTVVIRNSKDKIKSVSLETTTNNIGKSVRELELLGKTNSTNTYSGSFIAERPRIE